MQWWSPSSWDLFPGGGVERSRQQEWCLCKCQQIILLLSPCRDRQSCVPSSLGTILKTELLISAWDFPWYLLWDLVGWNFQVRQTVVKNVGSGASYLDLQQHCPISSLVAFLTSPLEFVAISLLAQQTGTPENYTASATEAKESFQTAGNLGKPCTDTHHF